MKVVKRLEDNAYFKFPNALAIELVRNGTHRYSTKSKFRSLLNRTDKLSRNFTFLKGKGQKAARQQKSKDSHNGNEYIYTQQHPKKIGWGLTRFVVKFGSLG